MTNGHKNGDDGGYATGGAVGDRPTANDRLGFQRYVRAFTEFLTNPDTEPPLTVSIEGEWGSEKSSFLELLQSELEDDDYTTFRFDPWRHDNEEALWAAFATQFIRELRSDLNRWQRYRGDLQMFRSRVPLFWNRGWSGLLRVVSTLTVAVLILLVSVLLVVQSLTSLRVIPIPAAIDNAGLLFGSSGLLVGLGSLMTVGVTVSRVFANPVTTNIGTSQTT